MEQHKAAKHAKPLVKCHHPPRGGQIGRETNNMSPISETAKNLMICGYMFISPKNVK